MAGVWYNFHTLEKINGCLLSAKENVLLVSLIEVDQQREGPSSLFLV